MTMSRGLFTSRSTSVDRGWGTGWQFPEYLSPDVSRTNVLERVNAKKAASI